MDFPAPLLLVPLLSRRRPLAQLPPSSARNPRMLRFFWCPLRVTERHPPPQWFDSPLLLVPLCSIPVSNDARSSVAVDFLTPLPLVPLLPGGGGPCPPPSRRRHLGRLPPSNERNPSPQWIFPLRYSLSPSFPGGGLLHSFHRVAHEILHRSEFSRSVTPCPPLSRRRRHH